MPDLTEATLAELERLEQNATQEPWELIGGFEDGDISHADGAVEFYGERFSENAALVAAVRNALPALLAAAKRAMKERETSE